MKTSRFSNIARRGLLAMFLALLAAASLAADTGMHKVVDGVSIYIGVLPAQMLRGHPKTHPEGAMHGGVPGGENNYHLVVALFDEASGKRITGAWITASVSELGLAGEQKKLSPMVIAGTVTYGNYFSMPSPGQYRINLEIERAKPHTHGAIAAEFEYQRP